MKKILVVLAVLLFGVTLSIAVGDLFSTIDKNKDGKISKQEYLDAVIATFNKYDLNKDGILTKDEIKLIKKIDARKFIKDVDSNKDGKISKQEFVSAAEKKFLQLDKNKDGYIDKKEWSAGKSSACTPFILFTF